MTNTCKVIIVLVIVAAFTHNLTWALPLPQDEESNIPAPPPVGSKPPGLITALENEDVTKSSEDDTSNPDEVTPAPVSEDPGSAPLPVAGNAVPATGSKVVVTPEDDCGPSCQLANQTPIILIICLLVLIILLLIILFGCYFIRKLHGKAIFTTVQRPYRGLRAGGDGQHPKAGTASTKPASPSSGDFKDISLASA